MMYLVLWRHVSPLSIEGVSANKDPPVECLKYKQGQTHVYYFPVILFSKDLFKTIAARFYVSPVPELQM